LFPLSIAQIHDAREEACVITCFGKENDPTSSENQSGEILADNQNKANTYLQNNKVTVTRSVKEG